MLHGLALDLPGVDHGLAVTVQHHTHFIFGHGRTGWLVVEIRPRGFRFDFVFDFPFHFLFHQALDLVTAVVRQVRHLFQAVLARENFNFSAPLSCLLLFRIIETTGSHL